MGAGAPKVPAALWRDKPGGRVRERLERQGASATYDERSDSPRWVDRDSLRSRFTPGTFQPRPPDSRIFGLALPHAAAGGAAAGGAAFAVCLSFRRAIVARSRCFVPGFRGISSLASLPPVFHGPGTAPLPLATDLSAGRQTKTVDIGE